MTTICAVRDAGGVWMGSNSVATLNNDGLRTLRAPKIFRSGPFCIGVSGAMALNFCVRLNFVPPVRNRSMNVERFIHGPVREELRRCLLLESGTSRDKPFKDVNILLGYESHIFEIHGDGTVVEAAYDYAAIGSGAEYALGAMYASHGGHGPREVLECALGAACEFDNGSRGPFTILSP